MTSRTYVCTSLALVAVSVLASLAALAFHSGETVAVHWTTLLQPDRRGSAMEFAVTVPLAEVAFFVVGLVAASRDDDNDTRAAVVALVALCTVLHVVLSIGTFL